MNIDNNSERLKVIEIILNKLDKDEYFDMFDRLILTIFINDYKQLLKGNKNNECKKHK